jgi:hypothetical protein
MSTKSKTDSETVRRLWQTYLPNIGLTETRWYETYDSLRLGEALQIAAERIKEGQQFTALDEQNVGRYVIGIIRNRSRGDSPLKVEVSIPPDYKISQNDRDRFCRKLEGSGDCLFFNGASTTGGYAKFWVNRRSVAAHVFAFFSEHGYLPAANALGGRNGLQVAHNCRNRSCCNPRHLRLTTKGINLGERVYSSSGISEREDTTRDYGSPNGSACYTDTEIHFGTTSTSVGKSTSSHETKVHGVDSQGVVDRTVIPRIPGDNPKCEPDMPLISSPYEII